MEAVMLIQERGGNGSAMAAENRRIVHEARSEKECNLLLGDGWGLLAVVPGYLYQEPGVMVNGVIYIMSRTVK